MKNKKLFGTGLLLAAFASTQSSSAEEFCNRFSKTESRSIAEIKLNSFSLELKRVDVDGEEVALSAPLVPLNESANEFFMSTASDTQICVNGHFSLAGGGRTFYVFSARNK